LRSQKVDESIAAVIKDVNNVVIGNIDKDILNKAKKACQKVWETSMQENETIARYYANWAVIYNKSFGSMNEFHNLYMRSLQKIYKKWLENL
jgi:hypothetical protein